MKLSGMFSYSALLVACALAASPGVVSAHQHKDGDTRTVEVVAKEFTFEPSRIEVAPGSRVEIKLINEGNLSHNLHIAGEGMKTETIQTGHTDNLTVTAPENGKLKFFCNVPGHKQAGMTGEIVAH
ncbi:cupredoxin domain-containing protein [Marinobacter sp. SS13-12]|uniref:cupredoxin domain-containing protein n=1 Tax=Marinobacter sp. SS13-12 TaxID=3050451 RepID=UPI0025578688|nr:cupredoxin domain-containing protein [Marinobacter sp. SS13-12]MDK8462351.1 cupredoxin domain-containing protein [Marinobacter sp. SS13-12]